MKRFFIFIIVIALFGCKKPNKKEYYVKPIEVVCDYPFNDTTKWAITCRVWGLLKYYHPNVTAGKLDWDKVLLGRMDRINDAHTPEQVNTELMGLIRDAGKYRGKVDKKWDNSQNMNVNLCWLDHSFINDTIRQELRKLASLTVEHPSHYVGYFDTGVYISAGLAFDNEKDYEKVNLILFYDYRLLALFRYWNVIYYFFPYKYLMDQSWDITLEEFIPQFLTCNSMVEYNESLLKIAAKLHDGHAFSNIPLTSNAYSPIAITAMIDTLTVIKNPPEQSLLKRGDVILSIDGKDIKSIRDSLAPFIPSSTQHKIDMIINSLIDIPIMEGCIMNILRNQEELTFQEIKKIPIPLKDSLLFYLISPNIGYVNLAFLKTSDIESIFDSLENTRGVIFDIRNYPNFSFSDFFCHLVPPEQPVFYAQANFADLSHIGAFYKNEKQGAFYTKDQSENCKRYKGKVIVLINEIPQSATETKIMMFRAIGATLIGTPTTGTNGTVAVLKLPGGIITNFSSLGFYYPDGEEIQRKGIIPDIEVYPTMESIMEAKDEILEEAIRYINSLK